MRKLTKVAYALVLASAQTAFASDSDLRWSGYMNLVGGMLKDKEVNDFTSNTQHPGVVGYENRFTGMQDTQFALQVSKKVSDKLSVTGQLIARGSVDSFKQEINWAYVTYDIDDNSMLRFGRLGLPTFYYSDYQYVGTAYHWISPPREVYDFALGYEGINYLRRDSIANIDLTTETFFGAADQSIIRPDGSIWKTTQRDLMGIILTANAFEWLTVRLMTTQTYGSIDTNYDIAGLLTGNGVPEVLATPAAADGATLVNVENAKYSYSNIGLKADFDRWFVLSEAMQVDSTALMPFNWRRWYISSGIRFGKATYHVTYGRSEDDYFAAEKLFSSFISQNVAQMIANNAASDNKSLTLGVRFDTTRTTAVKFEVTQFEEFASRSSETAGIGKNTLARVAFNASF